MFLGRGFESLTLDYLVADNDENHIGLFVNYEVQIMESVIMLLKGK